MYYKLTMEEQLECYNIISKSKTEYNISDDFNIFIDFTSHLENNIIKSNMLGCYYPNKYDDMLKNTYILINLLNIRTHDELLKTIYHEFRHAYQFYHYRDIYIFFMSKSKEWLISHYNNGNILEEDAKIFGETFGKKNKEYLFFTFLRSL